MRKLILTQETNCQYCYKCLRNCPVKAIMFNRGKSYVIDEECIFCGNCIEVCPQKARNYVKSIHVLDELKNRPFLVSIAPSFFAHFDEPLKVITFLKNLGAVAVQETAVGAEIVSKQYKDFMDKNSNRTMITTSCPVVFEMAEKYYPEVIPYLAPFLSPMNVHALFMKKYFGDFPVVYLGPCIAKKVDGEGYVDLVLTYEELEIFIERNNVSITDLEETFPTSPYPDRSRFYPISGGINSTLEGDWINFMVVEGVENIIKIFENIKSFKEGFVIEASACFGGCINGPAIRKDIGLLEKRKKIIYYSEQLKKKEGGSLDFQIVNDIRRVFTSRKDIVEIPEEKIRRVLKEMGKENPKKELNCGACGYSSCREKAIAVILGKAEKEMCITYLIDKVSSVSSAIIEEFPNIIIIYKNGKPIYINPSGEDFFYNKEPLLDFVIDEIESGVNPLEISIDDESYYFFVKTFELPDGHGKVALLLDITKEKKKEEELKKIKKESAEKIEELINRQMILAQEIASLLGESIAETKSYFVQFRKVLEEDANL